MAQITVGKYEIRSGLMKPMTQLHVYRRITPVVAAFMSGGHRVFNAAEALAGMSDRDVEYVVNECLAVCNVVADGQSHPLLRNGQVMFQDIDLKGLMMVAAEVIKENLGGFFNDADLRSYLDLAKAPA